jgi:hypothetical protein
MKFDLELSTQVLTRTPGAVHALLNGLPDTWTRATEGPDTFSPFDVVGHLIDSEETNWIPRANVILDQGANPLFAPYDRFRHRARNVGRTLDSLLEEFARLRAANLELLRSWHVTPAALELPGIHPTWGRVTLRQLLSAWVAHDLGHVAQIARVMAKQLRDDVGPWEAFLPVLTDHETPRS